MNYSNCKTRTIKLKVSHVQSFPNQIPVLSTSIFFNHNRDWISNVGTKIWGRVAWLDAPKGRQSIYFKCLKSLPTSYYYYWKCNFPMNPDVRWNIIILHNVWIKPGVLLIIYAQPIQNDIDIIVFYREKQLIMNNWRSFDMYDTFFASKLWEAERSLCLRCVFWSFLGVSFVPLTLMAFVIDTKWLHTLFTLLIYFL